MTDFPEAAAAARYYRKIGWNPLPSRTDVKGPALSDYARYRDGEPIPEKFLDSWWSPNLQVCTGVAWGLAVVDLDGPLARVTWKRWCRVKPCPRTWTSLTGGGGVHLYFSLPRWVSACKTRKVWGVWDAGRKAHVKHQFVEVLCDHSLVIAPPSVHVTTGVPYRWAPGFGPRDLRRPAPAPAWVLALPELTRPKPEIAQRLRYSPKRPTGPPTGLRREDVLGRLTAGEKAALAASWGLRLASTRPNAHGWLACHAVNREDAHPSASFHPESGYYWEPGRRLSLLDLAAELGAYATWLDARDALGEMT